MYYMLCLTNQQAIQTVKELNIPDTPVYLWTLSREDVRAIFYKGAVALLQKVSVGWMLSYMYTFPNDRNKGHMTYLLKEIAKHYRLYALPTNSIAEEVLQKSGFSPENHYFGSPYYRSN